MSGLAFFFFFRLVTIVSKYSRFCIFYARSKSSNRDDVLIVTEKLWFGDWFILMQLCKNMNPIVFHDLITDLRDGMYPEREENLEMGSVIIDL